MTFLKTVTPQNKPRFAMLGLALSGLSAQPTHSAAQQRTESIWVSYLGAIVTAGDGVRVNTADVPASPTTAPPQPAARHTTRIHTTTTPHATPTTEPATTPPTTTPPPTTSPAATDKHGKPPRRSTAPPDTTATGKP
jgi:hypothetical protein